MNKTGLQYFLANVLSVKCRSGLLYFLIKLPLSNLFNSAIGFRKGLPKRFRWENSKTLRLLNWVWYFSLKLLIQTFSIWPFICRCKYAWRIYQTSLAVHKKGCLRGSAEKATNYLIYEVVLIATMDGNTSSENDSARYYITEHSEDFFHPNSGFVINSVRNAPLMITSIIANTLVLTAILGMPMLRSPSLTLLCSQAVSEFLVGIVVQPLYIVN